MTARRVIVTQGDELSDAQYTAVIATLGASDRVRFDGLRECARPGFLAGRLAVRAAAARLAGVEASTILIEAQVCPDCGLPHARPVVDLPGVHVSLAHVTGLAVAVAARLPVGIDLERRDESAARVAAAGELTAGHDGDALRRWVRAEAVLKADGRGLRIDPARVRIRGRIAWISDDGRPAHAQLYRLHPVRLRDHVGAVAVAL